MLVKPQIARLPYFLATSQNSRAPAFKDQGYATEVNLMSDYGTCLLWLSLGTVKKGPERAPWGGQFAKKRNLSPPSSSSC